MSRQSVFDFQDDPQGLEHFLRTGGAVNEQNSQGCTLLHTTTNPAVAQVLLDYGLDMETTNADGETALLHALTWERHEYAAWLLEQGAEVNVADANGSTPLHMTESSEMTQLLIEHGADVSMPDATGMTPLHMAQTVERAQALINAGADVNARNCDYETPLFVAVNAEISDLLIQAGADVSARAACGRTALHVASNGDQARILIAAGADVNAVDTQGQTPLFDAGRNLDVATELVAAGADISHKDAQGKTAEERNPRPEVARFFESYRRVQALEKLAGISREEDLATPEQALAKRARYGRMM